MNVRILKLAQQAAAVEGWGPEVWQTTYSEKFAELIIQECGNIAFEHWALTHSTSPQEAILKHFEVEA